MKKTLALVLTTGALAITSATAVGAETDPDPIWPVTPQDCRWTGADDPASWDQYRDYWNDQATGEIERAGDIYFSSQGQCMRNRGENPFAV